MPKYIKYILFFSIEYGSLHNSFCHALRVIPMYMKEGTGEQ